MQGTSEFLLSPGLLLEPLRNHIICSEVVLSSLKRNAYLDNVKVFGVKPIINIFCTKKQNKIALVCVNWVDYL